jgi:hypothetical protein
MQQSRRPISVGGSIRLVGRSAAPIERHGFALAQAETTRTPAALHPDELAAGLDSQTVSPTTTNGKLCYVEIPATDVAASAAFYAGVFGWTIRTRGDGHRF